jgi:hypothetical protein
MGDTKQIREPGTLHVLGDQREAHRRNPEAIDSAYTNVRCVTKRRPARHAVAKREFELGERHRGVREVQDLHEFAARFNDDATLA